MCWDALPSSRYAMWKVGQSLPKASYRSGVADESRARGDLWSRSDRRLLEAFARQAGVAAHGVRVTRELRRSRERIVSSREEERRRIRRDLHDGVGPALAGITLGLETAGRVARRDPGGASSLLQELRSDAADCIDEVRRIVADLRPPALDAGLTGALRHRTVR